VIFTGRLPSAIVGKSFLEARDGSTNPLLASGRPAFPSVRIIRRAADLIAALRDPDIVAEPHSPGLKYVHRSVFGGEVYFAFNEGAEAIHVTLRLRASGGIERWDPETGAREPWHAEAQSGMLGFPLHLLPGETALFVTSSSLKIAPKPAPAITRRVVTTLDGTWRVEIDGRDLMSRLRPWADLGFPSFSGTGTYEIAWNQNGLGRDCVLDLSEVNYAASVTLNGRNLGLRAWRPFRWSLGNVATGENRLVIEVTNTGANQFAGNPRAYAAAHAKGWVQNSYARLYLDSDREMLRSGLMGPVTLRCF
jgi:hypothetical protein